MAAQNPRLAVEIGAITTGLKKGLSEARSELKKFASEASKTGYKDALAAERVAQAQSRTEAVRYRTEIAKLALEKRKNAQVTTALSGSYREAQQRLTALGRSIREAAGGFTNTTPAVRAQISEYNRLNTALKSFDAQMGNHYRNVGNYSSAISTLSPQLSMLAGRGGGFLAAGLAARDAYRSVSQFDSGMRNVEKTTGLSRSEVDKLGTEFVKLSKELQTISSNQLTQYATIAGQLGVKGTRDITSFTESLAKLETATNISGEQGGAEIARTLTLIDGGVQNVRKFSDEIVNLGNNFAATEKEILGNAEAIAQNTAIFRFSRQDVLAYATATKSLGVEAEVVGSTFQKTLGSFEQSIRTGKGLDEILRLIGGSANDLRVRFANDAAGVFQDYIKALNGIQKSGGSVMEQMERNGIQDIRQRRVIATLATGYDTLARSIDTVRNSSGALDSEFETASGKIVNQTNRIKVSWENLILSIEQGTGAIGKTTVAFADMTATILDGFTNIVSSKSWSEFFSRLGELSGNNAISFSSRAVGNLVRMQNDSTSTVGNRGLVSYEQMKDFYRATEDQQRKEIIAQEKLVEVQAKEFAMNKENLKIRDSLLWNAEKLAKMRLQLASPVAGVTSDASGGGGGGGGGSKNPISDILGDLSGVGLNFYDAKIAKITNEYEKLVAKIKASSGSDADISKALNLAGAKRDFDILKVNVDRFLDSTKKIKQAGVSITGGSATVPVDLPNLAQAVQRINATKPANLDDPFSKQMQSTLRRGLARTFDNLFSDISSLSQSNYDIERKYAELRENASTDQIQALQKMEVLEKRINSGLESMMSKISSGFTSIGSNLLSSALSTGISSGDFSDLTKMFTGKNKWMGIGAAGSLVGGALSSIIPQTSAVGQGLSGALSGAGSGLAIGTAIAPGIGSVVGAIGGALIGALSGIFGSSRRRRQEELAELQLKEQRKLVALQERQAALAYQSSIVGQMTNQGIVTSIDRDAFGNLSATIRGEDILLSYERAKNNRG